MFVYDIYMYGFLNLNLSLVLVGLLCLIKVHQMAQSLHLTPVTLLPVIFNLTSKEVNTRVNILYQLCLIQGIFTVWKGSIGSGVLWGLDNVTDMLLSDLFNLPRYVLCRISLKFFFSSFFIVDVQKLCTWG